MWKPKYVDIQNYELLITDLPSVDVIPEALVELAQMQECRFCDFNQARWFNFLKHVIKNLGFPPKIHDLHLFQMYGVFWFNDFYITDNNELSFAEYFGTKTLEFVESKLLLTVFRRDINSLLRFYNTYYGLKKNVKSIVNELAKYKNITSVYLTDGNFTKDDFADLPKGWKDKLPQLDKLLFSNALCYFRNKTFNESFHVLNQLKFYTKKYGVLFQQLIEEQTLNLDEPEYVKRKFYAYLNKNNRLLCEPLPITFSVLGNWRIVELNTTYNFVEESSIQNHCIGRGNYYISRVLNGELRAFSFRKIIDQREQRYTIVYERKGNVWTIGQGKCVNNLEKKDVFKGSDLKYLEVNIERLKKELEKQLRLTVEDDLF